MRSIAGGVLLMAASSGATLVLAVARSKVISVYVGVEGIGLLGALSSFLIFASALLGLGISLVGVRSVARTSPGSLERAETIWALRTGSNVLALAASALILVCAAVGISLGALPITVPYAAFLALGVGAAIASGTRVAVLNGSGRLGSVALATSFGAAGGTALTVVCALYWPSLAVASALCMAQVFTLLIAVSLERRHVHASRSASWKGKFLGVVALGATVTLGTAASAGAQFAVRSWVGQSGGLTDIGLLQAAWVIGSTYLGFILTAFAAEYFPRISAHARDPERMNILVDFQVRFAVILCLPVILATQAFAGFLVTALYSDEFVPSSDILLLQLPGDVFKIYGWAIAFALLALNDSKGYLLLECVWAASYLLLGVLLLPLGLDFLGAAYSISYLLYSAYALLRLNRTTGYRPSRSTVLVLMAASALTVLGAVSRDWHWLPSTSMPTLAGVAAAVAGVCLTRWFRAGALDAPLPSGS